MMPLQILGGLSIVVGIIGVLGGMVASPQFIGAIGTVIGGGFFMTLGVIAFIFEEKYKE